MYELLRKSAPLAGAFCGCIDRMLKYFLAEIFRKCKCKQFFGEEHFRNNGETNCFLQRPGRVTHKSPSNFRSLVELASHPADADINLRADGAIATCMSLNLPDPICNNPLSLPNATLLLTLCIPISDQCDETKDKNQSSARFEKTRTMLKPTSHQSTTFD